MYISLTKLLLQTLFPICFVRGISMSMLINRTAVQFAVILGLLLHSSSVSVVRWKESQPVAVN